LEAWKNWNKDGRWAGATAPRFKNRDPRKVGDAARMGWRGGKLLGQGSAVKERGQNGDEVQPGGDQASAQWPTKLKKRIQGKEAR